MGSSSHSILPFDWAAPIGTLPLNLNGMIDRKAPVPQARPAPVQRPASKTKTEVEAANAVVGALAMTGVEVTGDFVSLGGHSLLGAVGRLSERLDVEVSVNPHFRARRRVRFSSLADG
jgi:hypothetical protein